MRAALSLLAAALALQSVDAGATPACDRGTFAIAVDPGHTRAHPGAISARGVPEERFNEKLARRLASALRKAGFAQVFLTRSGAQELSLADRAELANQRLARLLVSIHHDSVQPRYLSSWTDRGVERRYSDDFSGYSLFVSERNEDAAGSLRLARLIGRELRARCFAPSLHHAEKIPGEGRELLDPALGVYRFDDLVVLRSARMPAVLVEAGVIVNRQEETQLRSAATQARLAAALTAAIEAFCAGTTPDAAIEPAPCR